MRFKNKKIIIFIISSVFCVSVVYFILSQRPGIPEKEMIVSVVPQVSVIETGAVTERLSVELMGEMLPEWESSITSKVEGEITFLSHSLKEGEIVKKGELLVSIENSAYRLGVSEAELRLAQAGLLLLREKNEAAEALSNWKTSGLKGTPDSPLVLREPYVKAAEKEMEAASDNLNRALRELEYTQIRSPFKGLVVRRTVSKGGTVFPGNEIAVIYGIDKGIVPVNLSMNQWKILSENLLETEVMLIDPESNNKWNAIVARDGKRIRRETRQRQLFIEIEKPLEQSVPLLPGTFLTVSLTGKKMENIVTVPESSLTRRGEIWLVAENQTLVSKKVCPLFRKAGVIYIENPATKDEGSHFIAAAPNSSFVNGRKVSPKRIKKEQ